jgi:hypothetical protein
VELVLTAPDGSQTGLNPITNISLESIPLSSYFFSTLVNDQDHVSTLPVSKTVGVDEPGDGSYVLQVFGTGSGAYEIDVAYYDTAGNIGTKTFSGTATPGVISTITIQYSSAVGAATTFTVACPADVNGDGVVDSKDVVVVAHANPSAVGSPKYNPAADINHDGKVDSFDVTFVSHSLGCKTQVVQ